MPARSGLEVQGQPEGSGAALRQNERCRQSANRAYQPRTGWNSVGCCGFQALPIGIFPTLRYYFSMTGMGERVAAAIKQAGMTQKEAAAKVNMKTDALSRALSGQRGLAAIELADLAELLHADLHYLITGEADPSRITISARHDYDADTGHRSVSGVVADTTVVSDICLAYKQVEAPGDSLAATVLPRTAHEARESLGEIFVPEFMVRLQRLGVDVVRVEQLSTSYSLTISGRPVIALNSSGNWFYENWSLAHELGHLALGHVGIMPGQANTDMCESQANAFAAELLLPAAEMRARDWGQISREEFASLLWQWGVSTGAVKNRLAALQITVPQHLAELLEWKTQKVLRYYWDGNRQPFLDRITERMTQAAQRHFPDWLKDAHLDAIAAGRMHKNTLAWMLEVDADELEVEEPAPRKLRSADELSALLG